MAGFRGMIDVVGTNTMARVDLMKCRIAFAALALSLATPALADIRSTSTEVRILSSSGGVAASYADFFRQVRKSGKRVVIDGPCESACTLVLNIVPRNRICVTRRAVLGFHAPAFVDRDGRVTRTTAATRAVAASYPPAVRAWIKRQGGLRSDFIYLQGRELATLYRRC